ncbi:hypothetical protein PSTG_02409 [Puccinia striiformis f. sp. tritici PST-78]|uniref:Uncharacterized protein n=2 Tax=Puccinia striiformis TaxID=27350 RepID=A0A0L0VYY5_9BASI|nr:hypothetical protein PSTG_02409 [Puccinia striiformis f. sp. tritici PST-78]
MARKTLREPKIDTELRVAYAKTDRLHDTEEFLTMSNVADQLSAGEQVFEAGLYDAARLLFSAISNWAILATTSIYLGDNQAAVDCARKAVKLYENKGYFEELMQLLEAGLGLERAHMGMFTELSISYAKHKPSKLMEHLKLFWSRINIPKVIRASEQARRWPELVFLYVHYDEFDNAVLAMMERSADAWDHSQFKDIIVKVANVELYYKSLSFYLQEQPTLLTDLLTVLVARIDHTRAVKIFQKTDNLPLIKPYLIAVQHLDLPAINEAYHDLLIEEEDYATSRDSLSNHENFDQVNLAQRLENHQFLEFRRLASLVYAKNSKLQESIGLSKDDKLFKDAMITAASSNSNGVVEELLEYFVKIGNKECFAARLYICYDLIRPDVVEDLQWRQIRAINDYTMPHRLQRMREQDTEPVEETEQEPIIGPGFGGRLMLNQGPSKGTVMGQPGGGMQS